MKDKHGSQYRLEKGNGQGVVQGSYGFTDENGVYREVHYIADKSGFRAQVKTNEPGTKSVNPADVELYSSAKYDDGEFFGQSGEQSFDIGDYRKSATSPAIRKRKHGGHEWRQVTYSSSQPKL